MPKYMILYRSSLGAGEQMGTPEQAQQGMQAWMNWAERAGSALVDMGSPLSSVGPMAQRRDGRRRRRLFSSGSRLPRVGEEAAQWSSPSQCAGRIVHRSPGVFADPGDVSHRA